MLPQNRAFNASCNCLTSASFQNNWQYLSKSPPKTIVIPPEGLWNHQAWHFSMSLKDLSTTSKQYLLAIDTSSQLIKLVCLVNSTASVFHLIPHILSFDTFKGMWNLECVVRPPSNNITTIPKLATISAILPSDLN